MSYEEEFDRIMRKKAEDLEYPFDEAHWDKASKMIGEHRKLSSLPLKKIAMTGAFVGALAIGSILFFDRSAAEPAQIAAQSTALDAESVKPAVLATRPEIIRDAIAESRDLNSEMSTAPSVQAKKTEHSISSPLTPVIQKNGVAAISSSRVRKPSSPESSANNRSATALTPMPESVQNIAVGDYYNTVSLNEDQIWLARKSVFLAYEPSFHDAILNEPEQIHQLKEEDYYNNKKTNRRIYMDAVGGGVMQNGWQYTSGDDARGVTWYGGFNIGLYLGRHFSLGTGMQAFNLAHITQPFYEVTAKDFDFGSSTSNTVITTSQLYYGAVPLKLSYHFQGGSKFSIGVLGAQLFRADNKIETSVVRDNSVIASGEGENNKLYQGMTQQLLMLTAGYDLQLSKRISAGAELVYGLNDIFTEGTYLKKVERPAGVRLGLTYTIFQK